MEITTMQDVQFIVGFDHNARFIHLFQAETANLPGNCEGLVGESLGTYAANDSDARLLRATLAECLFKAEAQECVVAAPSGTRYRFRFEKVVHRTEQFLRPDDEVVALAVISKLPAGIELTDRERQIVRLICCDMSNAEIADKLKIKTSTVETHRQNIRHKLGVRGTAGVVLYAVRQGMVD
jgi:DNA-binding NarL/FixJ family response regulator